MKENKCDCDAMSGRQAASGYSVLALVALIAIAGGCGGPNQSRETGSIHGIVTLGGVVFTEGQVALYSAAIGSGAQIPIDAEGKYSLGNVLATGEYQISVVPLPLPPPHEPRVKHVSRIPKKYLLPLTSKLTVQIGPGRNELDIRMEP